MSATVFHMGLPDGYEFDDKWADLDTRLAMVPGKDVLSRLNVHLQNTYGVAVTPNLIIEAMQDSDIADEMKTIIESLNEFAKEVVK